MSKWPMHSVELPVRRRRVIFSDMRDERQRTVFFLVDDDCHDNSDEQNCPGNERCRVAL